MRRSLPHDFGAPTPKRVPSYTPSPFGRCCPCSLPCYASRRLRSSSFLLPPPFALLLSSSSCASGVSTRQLPCLRATLPLTRLLDQDQRWYLGGAIPAVAWPRLVMFADSGDKLQSCRAARLGSASRNSERRFWCGPITTIWHSTGGGACHGRCSVPQADRGTSTTPLFSARDAAERSACDVHADARRRDATLARNAVAGRRPSPSSSARLFLYLPPPSCSTRIFHADEVSLLLCARVNVWEIWEIMMSLESRVNFFFFPRVRFRFLDFFPSLLLLLSKWHIMLKKDN